MCERNLGSTLSTFAINRQVGCHERLVRTTYSVWYVATHENSLMSYHYTA
jgi:hypothetical protein